MYRVMAAYALMVVVSGAALWAVLAIGSRLSAPTDLAGTWTIDPLDAITDGLTPGNFSIDQSGRFAMLHVNSRPPFPLTLQTQSAGSDPSIVKLIFQSPSLTLTAVGKAHGDDFDFTLTGAIAAQFHAHRTLRTYAATDSQSNTPASPATKP